jgi:hypothetical protein
MLWQEWNPFLLDESLSITATLSTMPGSPIKKIPFYVWLFENPSSPFRLAGATNLPEHDISHVVLGRGLLLQDEAFVIGFAMGNASDCSGWDRLIFEFAGRFIYQKPFRFRASDELAFDLAFDIGQSFNEKGLFMHPAESLLELSLGDVRRAMGLTKDVLTNWYLMEINLLPYGNASERLRQNMNKCGSGLASHRE